MKEYCTLKVVTAEPCSWEEYLKRVSTWEFADNIQYHYPKHDEKNGYITYDYDGWPSWCPESEFRAFYTCTDTSVDCMKSELTYLFIHWNSLNTKINYCPAYEELDPAAQQLLQAQKATIEEYMEVLDTRIQLQEGNTDKLKDLTFHFGVAVKLLEKGALLCRKGWNGKDMFVVKQVPAHITSDIIPKMTSLPPEAKKELMGRENPCIDYTSQCLLVQKNGRADSWTPSISDVFADDWQIYKLHSEKDDKDD